MDLALRRKGGMEYISDLKADPETKEIPIIIISGRDLSAKDVLEFKMKGVEYLRKGRVEMDEIKNTIRKCAQGAVK
jgi:DNA-binding response OmpR family regulator